MKKPHGKQKSLGRQHQDEVIEVRCFNQARRNPGLMFYIHIKTEDACIVRQSKNIIRNETADFIDIYIGFKIKREFCTITKRKDKLTVYIQNTCCFYSKILDF